MHWVSEFAYHVVVFSIQASVPSNVSKEHKAMQKVANCNKHQKKHARPKCFNVNDKKIVK